MIFQAQTACVAGSKHESAGKPGQDAVVALTTMSGAIVAVADGAGSRPLSHFGAEAAARHAVAYAGMYSDYEDLAGVARMAIHAAAAAVAGLAENMDLTARDIHSTLSLGILTERHLVLASVGDGVHVVRSAEGALALRGMAPRREFKNVTDFLSHPELDRVIEVYSADAQDVDVVLLASDGLDPLLVRGPDASPWPSTTAHYLFDTTAFGLWQERDYERFLCSEQVRRWTDDDCCVAIMRRAPAPGAVRVRFAGGAEASSSDEMSWPGGRRAWPLRESAGLCLVEAEVGHATKALIARRPSVLAVGVEAPLISWPSEVALDDSGEPFGLVIRRPIGTRLGTVWQDQRAERTMLVDRLSSAVAALHDAGFAHGSLSLDLFVVDRQGTVTLADPVAALVGPPHDVPARRARDVEFVDRLRHRAIAAPHRARGAEPYDRAGGDAIASGAPVEAPGSPVVESPR